MKGPRTSHPFPARAWTMTVAVWGTAVIFLGGCLAPRAEVTGEGASKKDRVASPDIGKDEIGGTEQHGLLNISVPSTGSLMPWLGMTAACLVAVKMWRAKRKACHGIDHVKEAIERALIDSGPDSDVGRALNAVKRRVCATQANKYGGIRKS